MFHTYIPTCLIVMMSWISFWIKPEVGGEVLCGKKAEFKFLCLDVKAVPARVTLGVTSLLTLSTQVSRRSSPVSSLVTLLRWGWVNEMTTSWMIQQIYIFLPPPPQHANSQKSLPPVSYIKVIQGGKRSRKSKHYYAKKNYQLFALVWDF